MLQILGWLGCLMLAVKLVEMGHNPTFRDEEGKLKETVVGLFLLGWAGVFGFALLFWVQGSAFEIERGAALQEEELREIADRNAEEFGIE